ncbi:MAG: transposase [Candidatus Binatia bacterium]
MLPYAYGTGKPSSRRIERATFEEVPYRVVAGDQHPDHDSIAAFRQRHLPALAGLFVQVLQLCEAAGWVKLGHVALEGTGIMQRRINVLLSEESLRLLDQLAARGDRRRYIEQLVQRSARDRLE